MDMSLGTGVPFGGGWGTIGLCNKFGTKKLAIGVGVIFGLIGAGVGYFISKKMAESGAIPQEHVILYTIGLGIGMGLLSAIAIYFTCTGIEYGLPMSKAKRSK